MFIWMDEFSVKIPLIDEQHKRLFEIGNQINQLLINSNEQDSFDEIVNQVNELIHYTKFHFSQEEKMMRTYHFQELDEHIQEHQQFIDYLDSFDYQQVNEYQYETLNDLVKFLASWIFKHIMNTDFKYSDHLCKALEQK